MQWAVELVNRDTGEKSAAIVEAPDAEAARAAQLASGFVVGSAVPVSSKPAPSGPQLMYARAELIGELPLIRRPVWSIGWGIWWGFILITVTMAVFWLIVFVLGAALIGAAGSRFTPRGGSPVWPAPPGSTGSGGPITVPGR